MLSEIEAPLLHHGEPHNGGRKHPHPRTVSRIVTRIQALMLELLPIQVDPGARSFTRLGLGPRGNLKRRHLGLTSCPLRRRPHVASFVHPLEGSHRRFRPDRRRLFALRPVRAPRGPTVLSLGGLQQPERQRRERGEEAGVRGFSAQDRGTDPDERAVLAAQRSVHGRRERRR